MRAYPKWYLLTQFLMAWLCFGSSVCADQADGGALNEEIVTIVIDGVEKRLDESGSSVSVVSEKKIESLQDAMVIDLLSRLPGLSISRNGGLGTVAALRIRGAEAGHTLVLIDGIRTNDVSAPDGAYNFSNLTVDNIERIEVLSGPQSTLYGSDAIGGVVNIITKRPDQPWTAGGTVETGSHETARASAHFGMKRRDFSAMLSAQGLHTAGISAADSNAGNNEADGFDSVGIRFYLSQKINQHLTIEGVWHLSNSWSQFDAFSFPAFSIVDGDGTTHSREFQGAVGVSWTNSTGRLRNSLRASWAGGRRRDHENGQASFDADNLNRILDFFSIIKITQAWTLLVGAQHQRQAIRVETFGDYASTLSAQTDLNGVFGEVEIKPLEDLNLTVGIRRDRHEYFGGHTTWRATAVYRLFDSSTLLRANWGTGYKAPTLFQLFSPFGDQTLRPEESQGWEVAIEREFVINLLRGSLVYFQRNSSNQIDYDLLTSRYKNYVTTQAQGLETRVEISLQDTTTIDFNYTHVNSFDTKTGLVLPRRPKNLFNFNIDHHLSTRLSLGVGIFFSGRQEDGGSALDAYKTVAVRAQYFLSDKINIFARVENVFDEDYQIVKGFGTYGMSLFFGLRGSY